MLNTFFLQQTGLGIGTVKNGIVLIIPSILQDIPYDAIGLLVSLLILMEDTGTPSPLAVHSVLSLRP